LHGYYTQNLGVLRDQGVLRVPGDSRGQTGVSPSMGLNLDFSECVKVDLEPLISSNLVPQP